VTAALSFATMCSARHHAFARHVPAALGGGVVLEVDGGDTGLLVVARADDVDGVAVTGIEDRIVLSIRKMTCLILAVARALSRRKQGFESPRERQ